ncbi:hypothetical protein BDR05DRAFT_961262 [Suillus weaverae]|nr:hypothetical protein BDR05DRAFT_961262 [Suillus weaverae]
MENSGSDCRPPTNHQALFLEIDPVRSVHAIPQVRSVCWWIIDMGCDRYITYMFATGCKYWFSRGI